MKILKAADAEGLVHIIDNLEGQAHTICNCCRCCCSFLVPINEKFGLDILSYSNYLAGVDSEVCIGCGACTSTCSMEAIRLSLREEVKPPPKVQEFVEARFKH